jgi:hypothetical protein
MPQPAYNSAKHHVGLGPSGSQKGLLLSGAYRKSPQRDGITAGEFGGERDIAFEAGHARWTQDDFSGGIGQDVWKDAAMLRTSRGFRPEPYGRGLMSIPPTYSGYGNAFVPYTSDGDVRTLAQPCLNFYVKGWFCVVYGADKKVFAFDTRPDSFGDMVVTTLANGGTNVAAWHRSAQILHVADDATEQIWRYTFNPTNGVFSAASPSNYDYPSSVGTRDLVLMNADGPRITCIFGGMIADLTLPDDLSSNVTSSSKQWAVNKRYKLPSIARKALFFNSQLYILATDEFDPQRPRWPSGQTGWRTQIVAWDGSDLYPVVDFPYAFRGRAMVDYAGRIFVGGESQDLGGGGSFGELYEISGSTLRAVRSWGKERRVFNSNPDYILDQGPVTIESLLVYEGLLWYFNEGDGRIDCYDITTDAFYGGVEEAAVSDPTVMLVPLGNTFGIYYHKTTETTASPPGSYTATLKYVWRSPAEEPAPFDDDTFTYQVSFVTSDFTFEPSRDKKFSEVSILTMGAPASACYASTNGFLSGGDTALSAIGSPVQDGQWWVSRFDASAIPAGKSFALNFEFDLDEEGGPDGGPLVVQAVTSTFVVLPSGKKAWQFVVIGAEEVEGTDGTSVAQDAEDLATLLFDWLDEGQNLVYTDLDGATYDVRVADIDEQQPIIGPDVAFASGTRPEATFNVSLIEI